MSEQQEGQNISQDRQNTAIIEGPSKQPNNKPPIMSNQHNFKDINDFQKTGAIMEEVKKWLQELGIDTSNFAELVKKDLEEKP